jgi:hypothetical protein
MVLCSRASANFSYSPAIIQAVRFDLWPAIKTSFQGINNDRNIAIIIIIIIIIMSMIMIIIMIGNNDVTAHDVFKISK